MGNIPRNKNISCIFNCSEECKHNPIHHPFHLKKHKTHHIIYHKFSIYPPGGLMTSSTLEKGVLERAYKRQGAKQVS